jgi:hypothetical protein
MMRRRGVMAVLRRVQQHSRLLGTNSFPVAVLRYGLHRSTSARVLQS